MPMVRVSNGGTGLAWSQAQGNGITDSGSQYMGYAQDDSSSSKRPMKNLTVGKKYLVAYCFFGSYGNGTQSPTLPSITGGKNATLVGYYTVCNAGSTNISMLHFTFEATATTASLAAWTLPSGSGAGWATYQVFQL